MLNDEKENPPGYEIYSKGNEIAKKVLYHCLGLAQNHHKDTGISPQILCAVGLLNAFSIALTAILMDMKEEHKEEFISLVKKVIEESIKDAEESLKMMKIK